MSGLELGFGLGIKSGSGRQRPHWVADFGLVAPGPTSNPAGTPYVRASSASSISPLVASPTATGFTTNLARIVTTTSGDVGLFLEGTTPNGHASDNPWDAATWAGNPLAGSSTTQDSVTLGPTGVAGCALHSVLSNGYGRHDSVTNHFAASAIGTLVTVQHWTKGAAGAPYGGNAYDGVLGHGSKGTLTGEWDHQAWSAPLAGRTRSVLPADGRDNSAIAGTSTGTGAVAGARTYRSVFHQIEPGPRASTWTTPGTTRAGGRCRIADLAELVVAGRLCLELDFIAPYDCEALPWSARLWTIDANNFAEIDQHARCIRVVVDGEAAWVSAPLTWSRGDHVLLRLDTGNGPTTGTVQIAGSRVCAINDGRTLAALPSSGTIDIASSDTALQLEGIHKRWRAYPRSPAYRTIEVSNVAELLAALAIAGRNTRVLLRAGVYRMSATLALTVANSGVAIANYPGEVAVLDGGEVVTGTWSAPDGSGVQTITSAHHSLQFWVDNVAGERARSSFSPAGWTWNGGGVVTAPSSGEAAKVGLDGWIIAENLWRTFRMRVKSIVGATITINDDDWANSQTLPGFGPTSVWFVEGAGYVGDSAGFFWHNRTTNVLSYKPRAGQDLTTDEAVVGKIDRLLSVTGSLDAPARDITISGIEMRHTTWTDPDDWGSCVLQGSILVRSTGGDDLASGYIKMPGAILAWAAHRLVVSGCVLAGLGSDGVSLRYGSQSCAVVDCTIDDIAGTALSSGNVTAFVEDPHPSDSRAILGENVFANCTITNVAQWNPSSHAVWGVYNRGLVVARNRIGPTSYTPIALGWGWGATDKDGVLYLGLPTGWPRGVTPAPTTETPCGRMRVVANYLEGYLLLLDDGGGIYTIGDCGNGGETVIFDNYVNQASSAPNASGLYFDQGSEHIVARHNVFDTQTAWAKLQATEGVEPFAVACMVIANYADGGGISAGPGNVIAGNVIGALNATALAIKAAAGPI